MAFSVIAIILAASALVLILSLAVSLAGDSLCYNESKAIRIIAGALQFIGEVGWCLSITVIVMTIFVLICVAFVKLWNV